MVHTLPRINRLLTAPTWYLEPTFDALVDDLLKYGDPVHVGGKMTYELRHRTVVEPLGQYPRRRGMAHRLIVAEALSFLAGVHDLDLIVKAAPKANPALFTAEGAYGPRFKGQWLPLLRELERDASTRRAVLHAGSAVDKCSPTTPCTNALQFTVRQGVLDVDVSMRSWDVVWGLPVDLAVFGALGLAVAWAFQLDPGHLFVHAGSLHAYADTADRAIDDGVGQVVLDPAPTRAVMAIPRFRNLQKVAADAIVAAREGDWDYLFATTVKYPVWGS